MFDPWSSSGESEKGDFLLSAKYNDLMNVSQMARALGSRGGRARNRRLSAAEKARIAALGGKARAFSIQAARRIADNFRYVAVLEVLRPPPRVKRLTAFAGPLPGIYSEQSQDA